MPSKEEIREIEGRVYLESAYDSLLMASLSLSPVVKESAEKEWSEKVKALNIATDLVGYALGKSDPFSLTTSDVIAIYQTATDKEN